MKACDPGLRELALELRAEGLSYLRIGRALGVSTSTARRWTRPGYADHSRAVSREAKRRRRGVCEVCGAETRYNGHRGIGVSAQCIRCQARERGRERRGHSPIAERAVAFLATPHHFAEIADHLGISKGYVSELLDRLRRYGLIERIARGVYVAANSEVSG